MKDLFDKEVIFVGVMKSGRLYLNLTSAVGWEDFPSYVGRFLSALGGKVVSKNDAVDVRVWCVWLDNQELSLVYEDFPVMVTLESRSFGGDEVIRRLGSSLGVGL